MPLFLAITIIRKKKKRKEGGGGREGKREEKGVGALIGSKPWFPAQGKPEKEGKKEGKKEEGERGGEIYQVLSLRHHGRMGREGRGFF